MLVEHFTDFFQIWISNISHSIIITSMLHVILIN